MKLRYQNFKSLDFGNGVNDKMNDKKLSRKNFDVREKRERTPQLWVTLLQGNFVELNPRLRCNKPLIVMVGLQLNLLASNPS